MHWLWMHGADLSCMTVCLLPAVCCLLRQVATQLETDTADMLNEMIVAVRKGGRISIVGV